MYAVLQLQYTVVTLYSIVFYSILFHFLRGLKFVVYSKCVCSANFASMQRHVNDMMSWSVFKTMNMNSTVYATELEKNKSTAQLDNKWCRQTRAIRFSRHARHSALGGGVCALLRISSRRRQWDSPCNGTTRAARRFAQTDGCGC